MINRDLSSSSSLDVGCGNKKISGCVGIDLIPMSDVDIVHDLNELPWPFEENTFSKIFFNHSISHLSNISSLFTELYRIANDGAIVEIVAPHFSSDNFKTDPTHKMSLGYRSMNYFVDNSSFGYRYISETVHFTLIEQQLSFKETPASWRKELKCNPLKMIGLESLANNFPRFYEKFLSGFLSASEVRYVLKVVKK